MVHFFIAASLLALATFTAAAPAPQAKQNKWIPTWTAADNADNPTYKFVTIKFNGKTTVIPVKRGEDLQKAASSLVLARMADSEPPTDSFFTLEFMGKSITIPVDRPHELEAAFSSITVTPTTTSTPDPVHERRGEIARAPTPTAPASVASPKSVTEDHSWTANPRHVFPREDWGSCDDMADFKFAQVRISTIPGKYHMR